MTSTTATHSDALRVLSPVSIIAQSDTRNIVYLINWLVTETKSGIAAF